MLNVGRSANPSAPDYWPGSHVDSGSDSCSDDVYANFSAESKTGAERRFGVVDVQVLSVTAECEDEVALAAPTTTPATTAAPRTKEATNTTLRTIKISPAGKSSRQKDEHLTLTQIQVNFWPEVAKTTTTTKQKTAAPTKPPHPRLFYKLLQDVRQILRKLPAQEVQDLIAH